MDTLLAFVVGGLYSAGLYMMMRRSIVKLLIGLALLGHASTMLIFTVGAPSSGRPPLVQPGRNLPPADHADPVPQALILTAIVISFGVMAFTVVLVHRAYQTVATDDLDKLNTTDQ